MLRNIFSNTVYIKVHPNRFEVKAIETGKSLVLNSPQAFTTRRLLVGQFSVANDLLNKGMKQLQAGRLFVLKPLVVIQPMAMVEDGLSEVEERVFHELAASMGARKLKVWVGHELSDSEVLEHAKGV
jgi:hypothetical protein